MFDTVVQNIHDAIWGWPLVFCLLFCHIYFTIRTKFIQRKVFTGIKLGFKKPSDTGQGNIKPFAALCSCLCATIGPANIIGVGAAIIAGGPGAVFWMWLIAFFGMMTNYSENVLGILYRRKNEHD